MPPGNLNESVVMTIVICFHLMGYRNFKHYYLFYVCKHIQNALLPLAVYLKVRCMGDCTGISYVDLTPLRACHIKRAHSHKVLKGLAAKGQCSIGWFFGLKLHFIINDKGEILDIELTLY